ncbi:MAG: hemolysin III family protein [Actinobacteria bacterium]|nr:hemolysin III family protein [Actinomycetota bacterium]
MSTLAAPTMNPLSRTAPGPVRPSWRGWIHRIGVAAFVPLSIVAIVLAPTAGTRVATTVYAVGVTAMLGVSAVYHCGHLSERTIAWMKRIDHTTILLGIAGSYTAIAVLALPSGPATHLLVFTWIAAVVGAVVRMVWLRAPYPVVATVYVAVGWGALLEWSALVAALSGIQLALLLGGGIVYTLGAVVYALHRPNPWPATFGYHEIFHALVMTGVVAHYGVVLSLILQAR